ncbi:MAG TPA: hypothetical protein PLR37_04050 [Candidatus Accumulibacter phosphatis]|nr:hypothetical protein [Candidatus Accumulibacter phosphatis]
MRIPLGNFGFRGADPVQHTRIGGEGADAVARSVQNLSGTGMSVAAGLIDRQTREQEALQQVRIAGDIQERQMQYDSVLSDLGRRSDAGELDHQAIPDAFKAATALLPPVDVDSLHPVLAEKTRQGLALLDHKAQQQISGFVAKGLKTEARFSVDRLFDGIDKSMADPHADPAKATAALDAPQVRIAAQQAYGDAAQGKLQERKDQAWFTFGKTQLIAAGHDADALRGFIGELDDDRGRFADKLDGDRKNALKIAAQSKLDQAMRLDQHEADKRLADAENAVKEYGSQITTTTSARPEDYLSWADRVRGTPYEAPFIALQAVEREVQKVVALPPEQQDRFLADARAAQRINGAGEKQIQMLNALEEAVGKNRKLMDEQPLRYLTERTGQAFQPLTPALLQQGGGVLEQEVQHRLSALSGLRKTTGGRTDLKLFSKDEADQTSKLLAESPPAAQGAILGLLRQAINDPRAYADTVRQVAKDDPVLAYAGIAQGRDLTTTNGRALSDLLLEGRAIVRDGSFKMPPEKAGTVSMQQVFSAYLGNAIEPGASSAREDTFKAASAVYAKLAKDAGQTDGALDAGLYEQAVRLTTGGIVEHAGQKTIPPYGMGDDVFNDRARAAKRAAEKASDAPAGSFATLPLRAIGPNRYELLNGQRRQIGKDGLPIILTIE